MPFDFLAQFFPEVGPVEGLVAAGLKQKIFFKKTEIESMMAAFKLPKPPKPQGQKNLYKRDLVQALAKHLLCPPMEEGSDEFQEIVDRVTAAKKPKIECAAEVLEAVSSLDVDNVQAFKPLL